MTLKYKISDTGRPVPSVVAMKELRTKYPGIRTRHHEHCALVAGGQRCSCGAKSVIARVSVPGSRRPVSKTWQTVSQARAWKTQTEQQVRTQPYRQEITVNELATRYLEALHAGRTFTRSGTPPRPASVRDIDGCINNHVLPRIGSMPVSRVRRGTIQQIVDELGTSGLSASRIHSVTAAVGSMWRWALNRDLAESMPSASLELPADRSRRELPPHTPLQVADLIRTVRREDRAAWALWAWAGLRKMEVARLDWADVDLRGRVVHIREGKSANATRTVPLIEPAVAALREHRTWSGTLGRGPVMVPLYRANPGTGWGTDKAIVRARKAWADENDWRELDGREPLVPLTPHPLRHLVGTWLMRAGVQNVVRSAWLGHSRHSLGVTDSVYTHVSGDDLQAAARMLEHHVSDPIQEDASQDASQ